MGSGRTNQERPAKAPFGAFLRRQRDAILDDWDHAARTSTERGAAYRPVLADYWASLLDRAAADADSRAERAARIEERRALETLDGSFELKGALHELSLFRETVLRTWQQAGLPGSVEERLRFESVLDEAVATLTEHYVNARDRLLLMVDRISAAALDARDLDELLRQIVDVVTRELPTVDFMTISLREGDGLRVRAARGLEEEVQTGVVIPIGKGLAGKIAAERRPIETASASTDPRVFSDAIRTKGVQAMYGVPLLAEGELLGVATMGSLTASAFSRSERLIFDAAAHRATSAIYQQVLRETAEARSRALAHSERRFRAAFENSAVGMAHLHPDGSFIEANPRYSEIVGYSPEELKHISWLDIAHPRHRAEARRMLDQVLSGALPSLHVEGLFRRADGRYGWCDVFVSAVLGDSVGDSYFVAVLQDITGRKEAERALRASEERLRLAVEATGLGTWDYDLETDSIIWSERTERLLGLECKKDVGCEALLSIIPDQDRELLERSVKEAIERSSADVIAHEHRILRPDDEERWLSTRARLVLDVDNRPVRVIGTVLDITEERRARKRAAFLAEASQVLASSLDLDVTLETLAKLSVPRMADLCVVDLVPEHGELDARSVIAHADPDKQQRIFEIHRRARTRSGPLAHVLETGETVLLPKLDDAAPSTLGPMLRELVEEVRLRSLLAVPLHDGCTRVGVLSLGQTSARRLDQEDVTVAVELANRAGDAIRNASLHMRVNHAVRMREQILGIVSHDLRNPLGVIDLTGQVLLGTESISADPSAQAHIHRILRSAQRMERLIRDLLDLSSLQSGQLSLDRGRCELGSILEETVEAHAATAKKQEVSIDLQVPREQIVIDCDRDRIIQVLGNLLSNAIKFSPPREHVLLQVERRKDEVFIAVHDRGPGIAPEDQARVFDPYWHKNRDGRGTGLGLFISKGIVDAHGGRIGVRSRPGFGSRFWLTLPVQG